MTPYFSEIAQPDFVISTALGFRIVMDIDPHIEDDDLANLRKTIADLIEAKHEAVEDGPERRFMVRRLADLRFSREEAGGIIKDLDPR